ncbi:hypothetical protein SAMN05216344_1038 [Polaromonas sp. OV174]|nr:hypothetical protein SAMN05216344_1038 [Polaromonas sp. OV174]
MSPQQVASPPSNVIGSISIAVANITSLTSASRSSSALSESSKPENAADSIKT